MQASYFKVPPPHIYKRKAIGVYLAGGGGGGREGDQHDCIMGEGNSSPRLGVGCGIAAPVDSNHLQVIAARHLYVWRRLG